MAKIWFNGPFAMRPHHIIHASGIVALLAITTSAVLAYSYPTIKPVVAAAPIVEEMPNTEIIPTEPVTAELPSSAPTVSLTKFGLPLTHALDRVTKKTFGMEVHPETSPVPNDRFNGYHVGVDFETTEDEQNIDVPVFAICDGPLMTKQYAGGYGGYALQSCQLDGETVVVLYGHLHLESINVEPKQELVRGETIGFLGKGYSHETDGVRKHLHLSIHRGTKIDIRGYVQTTSEVGQWLDVLPYLNH
jgi:murein DD-endopeptidase MepM/ murein hydrolase activator NlpD